MKKQRYFAILIAVVMTFVGMTGCEHGESITTIPGTTTTSRTEATPTEAPVAEPTEEATTPTEAVVEEPTPEDSDDAIGEIDFQEYVDKKATAREIRDKSELKELSLIFFDITEEGRREPVESGGYAVLKNGETYHCTPKDKMFIAYLYSPKQMEVATFVFAEGGAPEKMYDRESNAMNADTLAGRLQADEFYEGGTVTKEIYITYEDGTEETFTFTVTDQ